MKRYISATEFKAQCLAILDQVGESGDSLTITKRGKPVAVLGPVPKKPRRSIEGILAGKVRMSDDIVDFNMADDWEIVREADKARRKRA